MKQQEIEKIQSIEERMKAIMDNIDKDKEVILKENRKMAQELTEIKELLMGKLEWFHGLFDNSIHYIVMEFVHLF